MRDSAIVNEKVTYVRTGMISRWACVTVGTRRPTTSRISRYHILDDINTEKRTFEMTMAIISRRKNALFAAAVTFVFISCKFGLHMPAQLYQLHCQDGHFPYDQGTLATFRALYKTSRVRQYNASEFTRPCMAIRYMGRDAAQLCHPAHTETRLYRD